MKLKFNAKLGYQLDAINSVVDLFEGMPHQHGDYTELGIANAFSFNNEKWFSNLLNIQERNFVEKSKVLIEVDDHYPFPNFSVEMETGTGKTYVYLRSIFELNKRYGLKKFIIVVPTVAIREGVTSSIRTMKEHFRRLYENVPFDYYLYQSKDLSKVRQFATSNTIQIMVINIQAFQRDAGDIEDYHQLTESQRKKLNIIHQDQDKMSGRRPIEFIQTVRPIIIIDEPQSVDNTPKSKRAIKTLNPLMALRYSATHKNSYNVLYELGPIKAYDKKLVKQITISSIVADKNINQMFLRLDSIGYSGKAKSPSAKVTIFETTSQGTKEKSVKLKQGLDLSDCTQYDGYQGYVVDEIYAEPGAEYVRFTNNKILELAEEKGGVADDVMKAQIVQTVEEHFKKERNLQKQGKAVKVLSLFFIDKVNNYRYYDENGKDHKGKLALWFEEAYNKMAASPLFSDLPKRDVETVHNGYFSADKKRGKVIGLKDTSGSTKADDETYSLIMRDKEKLLDDKVPLRFIFSHSALKEGWDNPNVFQICSLREFGTERERRQTLGRGLRLPVDANGDRIYDPTINRLTVIASESFENYAKQLQSEMEKDIGGGFKFGRVPEIAFAAIVDDKGIAIGQESSKEIWNFLQKAGYIDKGGDITNQFTPDQLDFALELPDEYQKLTHVITDKLASFIFSGRVLDNRKRQAISYNKRVELNPDFQALWEKIKHKTRYSIEFETYELIEKAVLKIKEMPEVKPVSITINTTQANITHAGIEAERQLQTPKTQYVTSHDVLPDILSFLQRETELTRGTLVIILKQCGRISEFKLNPQAFMSQVSLQINKALYELLVEGIKYEKIDGESYEMSLFDQPEVEAYLDNLYQVRYAESDNVIRTPLDYVEYDSNVEKLVAKQLDESENVRFYCKLPRWFKVKTPVGDYNPDWAVVLEADEKLYLIRETKSTHDSDQRRLKENLKVKCGDAHFKALDGVNFKVAIGFSDIVN